MVGREEECGGKRGRVWWVERKSVVEERKSVVG